MEAEREKSGTRYSDPETTSAVVTWRTFKKAYRKAARNG
jgi:hypothetical protein